MAGRGRALLAILALSGVVSATPALAHPHVWVAMHSDIVFNDQGLIDGINVEWTFDDAYTQMALDDLDTNGDGVYSQDELAQLTKDNLDALRDYDYFAVVRFNGEKQPIDDATDYGQIWSDGKLELHFHLPLKTPIDPRTGEFVLKIYDPDFFVAMDYVKDEPVTVLGNIPENCKLVVKPVPTDAELQQTRAMLATKPRDWKPENNEDFGALFAQAVTIACQP
jgi:ABC-type uncharacterized transport system substrate-binding protein